MSAQSAGQRRTEIQLPLLLYALIHSVCCGFMRVSAKLREEQEGNIFPCQRNVSSVCFDLKLFAWDFVLCQFPPNKQFYFAVFTKISIVSQYSIEE